MMQLLTESTAIDYPGIAVLIAALASFITTVGGFVVVTINQNRTIKAVTEVKKQSTANSEKIEEVKTKTVETHDLVNGLTEQKDKAIKEVAKEQGRKQGLAEGVEAAIAVLPLPTAAHFPTDLAIPEAKAKAKKD